VQETWSTVSRDTLSALYENLTITAIAARYEVTFAAVYQRLKNYGILKSGDRRHPPGPRKGFRPPKDELERLYQTMSMAKIAAHYGVGETVVFTRLKQYGIGGISRSERLKAYKKTPEHLAKIAETNRRLVGALNPNWKGGVSSENLRGRSNFEFRAWKTAVFEAANFKCEKCGVQQGHICECCGTRVLLHAHHIKPFSEHPELRYDVTNGIALCPRCHRKEHFEQIG
jgi:HNH endonuclease